MNIMRVVTLVLALALLALTPSCARIGETAGKAQAGIEKAAKDTKKGYNKGYEEGKKD